MKGDTLETIGHAAMAFVVIFAVVLLSGICFAAAWRQECMACHKERPHVKAYICPECKKAALEAEKEDK